MKRLIVITVLGTFLVGVGALNAFAGQDSLEYSTPHLALFDQIERGLITGDVRSFSKYFAHEVFLDLRGVESGYFSGNQAFYVLQNFLTPRRVIHFKFTTFDRVGSTPYATGGGSVMLKGRLETLQIYIALTRGNKGWAITQFNAY